MSGDKDDQLIKWTWGSIFVNMAVDQHQEKGSGNSLKSKYDLRETVSTSLHDKDDTIPLHKSFNTRSINCKGEQRLTYIVIIMCAITISIPYYVKQIE